MLKSVRNLPFAVIVSLMFAIANGAIIWSMPIWMLDGLISPPVIGALVTQASWALQLDAAVLVAGATLGLTWLLLCPVVWLAAQMIWPARQTVTVSPMPPRCAALLDREVPLAQHAPVLELPKFLAVPDAMALPERPDAPARFPETDPVLIIEPAPVQPPRPAQVCPVGTAHSAAGEESVADLLDRFEKRLARVRQSGLGRSDLMVQARTSSPDLSIFAMAGRR